MLIVDHTRQQADSLGINTCAYYVTSNHFYDHTVNADTPHGLQTFVGYPPQAMPKDLPFRLNDYLVHVDWTGRAILERKGSHIPGSHPLLLERLQIDPRHWLYIYMSQHFESRFKGPEGASYVL